MLMFLYYFKIEVLFLYDRMCTDFSTNILRLVKRKARIFVENMGNDFVKVFDLQPYK